MTVNKIFGASANSIFATDTYNAIILPPPSPSVGIKHLFLFCRVETCLPLLIALCSFSAFSFYLLPVSPSPSSMIISEQKALFPLHEMIVEEKEEACFGRSQALSAFLSHVRYR